MVFPAQPPYPPEGAAFFSEGAPLPGAPVPAPAGFPPPPGGMDPSFMPPMPGPAGIQPGAPTPTSPVPAAPAPPAKLPDPEPGSLMAEILDIRKEGRQEGNVQREEMLARRYPKPELADITGTKNRLETHWGNFRRNADYIRKYREHEDFTPPKWQLDMSDGRRGWMNLSNDEILWCVANATRNAPVVTVPPISPNKGDQERADKQERWLNALIPALERKTIFWHPAVDQQHMIGLGGFLFYFTDAYDQIDFDPKVYGTADVPDDENLRDALEVEMDERAIEFRLSKSGKKWEILESPSDYRKRTNRELEEAGLPFGVRQVDMTSTYFEDDGQNLTVAVIAERKAWPAIRQQVADRLGEDEVVPPVSQQGSPELGGWTFAGDSVECITYYDRRWYAYVVGGRVIEIKEHNLPRIPLFILYGNVTSASDPCHRFQGVVHGMQHMEQYANDAWSIALDNAMKYGRARWVLQNVNPQMWSMMDEAVKNSFKIDLAGDDNQVSVMPGDLVNTMQHVAPNPLLLQLLQQSTQGFQASGLAPVSKGVPMGADAAGYAIHQMQSTGLSKYATFIDNDERTLSEFLDFVRVVIRDVLGEKAFLVADQVSGSDGEREVLGIGPEEIGATIMPADVLIDSMSEPNRVAMQQIYMQAADKFVPWEEAVRKGFKAKDPSVWKAQILENRVFWEVLYPAYQEQIAMLLKGTPPPDLMGQMQEQAGGAPEGMPPVGGMPLANAQSLNGQVQQSGGTPAPLQPPAGVPANMMGGQQPTDQGRGMVPAR